MSKVILITGGSDGLGKTLATDLAKDNQVIIMATNEDKLKKVSKEIGCDYYIADVSSFYEVDEKMCYLENKYGKVDVLINNAGLWIQEELDQNEPDRIEEVVKVNLLGVINVTKSVIPIMKENKEGLIINVNSQAGINYKAERVVYNASKWGVTGFCKSLEPELAKYGVRVTNLMPGMMKTDMFKKMDIEKNMANGLDTKEVARLVRFLIDTPKDVTIPEVGIKNINN